MNKYYALENIYYFIKWKPNIKMQILQRVVMLLYSKTVLFILFLIWFLFIFC